MTPEAINAPLTTEQLRSIPLLHDLGDDQCPRLTEICRVWRFAAGEMILRQGETSQSLWLVLEGQCEVLRQPPDDPTEEPVVLATLDAGSNFGEMSFFHAAPHSASVRAKGNVTLVRIERGDFDLLVARGDCVAYRLALNVVASLAERLRRMDEWVAQLVSDDEDQARRETADPAQKPQPMPNGSQPVPEWTKFRNSLLREWNL